MPDDAEPDRARRSLLDLALGVTAGAVAGVALIPAARFATPPARPAPGAASARVGPRAELAENTARLVSLDGEPVLVIALPGGDLRAFAARCPHLGCVVGYSPEAEQIRCPCHGGRFGCDGRVLAGPPPSPLREVTVVVRRGDVLVERG
jgi:Rieske Fe-S protein